MEKKVVMCLYSLKDTGLIWMTNNTCGVHQCIVSKVIVEVCYAIVSNLSGSLIQVPVTVEQMCEKVADFGLKFGMVQAFDCLDGTHIHIKTPSKDSADFFNKNQYFY